MAPNKCLTCTDYITLVFGKVLSAWNLLEIGGKIRQLLQSIFQERDSVSSIFISISTLSVLFHTGSIKLQLDSISHYVPSCLSVVKITSHWREAYCPCAATFRISHRFPPTAPFAFGKYIKRLYQKVNNLMGQTFCWLCHTTNRQHK